MSTQLPVYLDDRDRRLDYSQNGNWIRSGKYPEFDNTTTSTKVGGATVTLTFNGNVGLPKNSHGAILIFQLLKGTSIRVFGSVSANADGQESSSIAPQSSYTIDGGATSTFTPALLDHAQRSIPFFSNVSLTPDEHTLIITTLIPGGFFSLDYIAYLPLNASTSSTTTHSTASGLDAAATTSSLPAATGTQSVSVGTMTIVGAVLGGFGLIFLAGIIFVTCKYYQKRYSKKKPEIHIFRDSRFVVPRSYLYDV